MRRTVQISDIEPLPISVTIPVSSQIRTCTHTILQGRAPLKPIMLAKCDKTLYCIDGMETLESYRVADVPKASCIIITVRNMAEAVLLHVGMSRRIPTNPFLVIDAIQWAKQHGANPTLDAQHAKLFNIQFHKDVKPTFNRWMDRLAERLDVIPLFWHIFEPLSEIKPTDQCKALDSVMTFVHTTGTSPDASSLRSILHQFTPTQSGTTDHITGIEAEPYDRPTKEYTPPKTETIPGTNCIRCSCGVQWYVDTKNKSVRRIQDSENMMILTDSGEPVYAVPPDVAEHLEMGGKAVHHYVIPNVFPAVMVSKRPLPNDTIQEISHILQSHQ